MSRRARLFLFLPAGVTTFMLLTWAYFGLPSFGHYQGPYGDVIARNVLGERHVPSAIAAIVFDYRGFDSVGEELILLASVLGVTMLLREQASREQRTRRSREEDHRPQETSVPIVVAGLAVIAPVMVLGLQMVTHGQLSPGGGFQGGAVLATAPLFIYLAGSYVTFRRLNPHVLLDVSESSGAAGLLLLGLVALIVAGAYLQNFLPLGIPKTIFSGGTIPLANLVTGLAVSAGFVFIVATFLEETLLVPEGR
jgi:multicomponent Na+:H+ antiporter subunit B